MTYYVQALCQALSYYTSQYLWGQPHPKQRHSYQVWRRVPHRNQGQRPNFFLRWGQIFYYILIILINIHFKYSDCWSLCVEGSSDSSNCSVICIPHVVAPASALRKGILCLPLYKTDSPTLPHVGCHYGTTSLLPSYQLFVSLFIVQIVTKM